MGQFMNFATSAVCALAISFLFYDQRKLSEGQEAVAIGGFGGREAGPVRGYERVEVGKIGGEQWTRTGGQLGRGAAFGGGTSGI